MPPEEIAFTRNAAEALKALILGYNRLQPGDAVLYADLDYDSMQRLGSRRNARVIKIALRSLRDRWIIAARRSDGIEVLTPYDPALHGRITSFRLRGVSDTKGNMAVAAQLLERRGIFTVHRDGSAKGACVRVTPALVTQEFDIDALAAALGRAP